MWTKKKNQFRAFYDIGYKSKHLQLNATCVYLFKAHTVGARIPYMFGIRMVENLWFIAPTIQKPNYG